MTPDESLSVIFVPLSIFESISRAAFISLALSLILYRPLPLVLPGLVLSKHGHCLQ